MYSNSYEVKWKHTKEELDKISPSACAAKWNQTTIHLQTGQTHSCHHPKTHHIPLEEIEKNPSALHNTSYKKQQREKMMKGERPRECSYCWGVEDNTDDYSDRVKKSSTAWASGWIPIVAEKGHDWDPNPAYVEVSFSSVCNFGCIYCSPDVSSVLWQELERYGPYRYEMYSYPSIDDLKESKRFPIPIKEHNPYVEAWWKWWPELYKDLRVFRITGGEPLLSKETFKTLDWIIENPNPEIEVAINTNLCVPDELFEKFLEKVSIINKNKSVRLLHVFTSCDTQGKHAEYIRSGMNYDLWLSRFNRICNDYPWLHPVVMVTFNLFSVFKFKNFLEDMSNSRKIYKEACKRENIEHYRSSLDFPHLSNPKHMSITLLDDEMKSILEECNNFIQNDPLFFDIERKGFQRVVNFANNSDISDEVRDWRMEDLRRFLIQVDKRKGTDFTKDFPEIEDFIIRYDERVGFDDVLVLDELRAKSSLLYSKRQT